MNYSGSWRGVVRSYIVITAKPAEIFVLFFIVFSVIRIVLLSLTLVIVSYVSETLSQERS